MRVCNAIALQLPQARHLGPSADIYNLSPNITVLAFSKIGFPGGSKYIRSLTKLWLVSRDSFTRLFLSFLAVPVKSWSIVALLPEEGFADPSSL